MIDWNKPVETTKGEKVTVLCTDLNFGEYKIGVRIEHNDGTIRLYYIKPDGTGSSVKLVNSPARTYLFYPIVNPKAVALIYFGDTEDAVREREALYGQTSYNRNFTGIVKVTLENGVPVKSEIIPA